MPGLIYPGTPKFDMAESLPKKAKNLGQQWRKGRFGLSEGPVFLRPDPGCAQC